MTTWNLETGCETIVPRRRPPVPKTLTAHEIADRCEALGARVDRSGNRYKVYPPDQSQRPVFFARKLHSGPEIPNILNTLAKAGLDVLAEPEKEPAPVPEPLTQRMSDALRNAKPSPPPARNGRIPTPPSAPRINPAEPRTEDELLGLLVEAEKRIEAQGQQILGLSQQLTDIVQQHDRVTRNLVERIMRLEEGRLMPPRVTVGQLVREAVLAFLQARPGERWTPQMIELNIKDLPEERGKTAVANACKDLATEGQLQGGGSNKKGEPQTTRGIYWYEPTDVVGDQDATARLAQGE